MQVIDDTSYCDTHCKDKYKTDRIFCTDHCFDTAQNIFLIYFSLDYFLLSVFAIYKAVNFRKTGNKFINLNFRLFSLSVGILSIGRAVYFLEFWLGMSRNLMRHSSSFYKILYILYGGALSSNLLVYAVILQAFAWRMVSECYPVPNLPSPKYKLWMYLALIIVILFQIIMLTVQYNGYLDTRYFTNMYPVQTITYFVFSYFFYFGNYYMMNKRLGKCNEAEGICANLNSLMPKMLIVSALGIIPRILFNIFILTEKNYYSQQFSVLVFVVLSEFLPSLSMMILYSQKIFNCLPHTIKINQSISMHQSFLVSEANLSNIR